jgi:hypothetical protein
MEAHIDMRESGPYNTDPSDLSPSPPDRRLGNGSLHDEGQVAIDGDVYVNENAAHDSTDERPRAKRNQQGIRRACNECRQQKVRLHAFILY